MVTAFHHRARRLVTNQRTGNIGDNRQWGVGRVSVRNGGAMPTVTSGEKENTKVRS